MTLFTIKVVYIFVIAVILAILEIQIEGPHGWAKSLPTWRPNPESRVGKIFSFFAHGKECTGYHLSLFVMLFLFFHLPFVSGTPWNWQLELEALALYTWFVVIWDFLWFVLNPHHPLKYLFLKKFWWHDKYVGKFPVDYYWGWLSLYYSIFRS